MYGYNVTPGLYAFCDEGLFPVNVADDSLPLSRTETRGEHHNVVVAIESGINLLREIACLFAGLVDRHPELRKMRDIHQQVIDKELYFALIVWAEDICQAKTVLSTERMIAHKCAQPVFRQVLYTGNVERVVEILHEGIDKVYAAFVIINPEELVHLILMHNLLQIRDKETGYVTCLFPSLCSQNLIYIYLQVFTHALLSNISI